MTGEILNAAEKTNYHNRLLHQMFVQPDFSCSKTALEVTEERHLEMVGFFNCYESFTYIDMTMHDIWSQNGLRLEEIAGKEEKGRYTTVLSTISDEWSLPLWQHHYHGTYDRSGSWLLQVDYRQLVHGNVLTISDLGSMRIRIYVGFGHKGV